MKDIPAPVVPLKPADKEAMLRVYGCPIEPDREKGTTDGQPARPAPAKKQSAAGAKPPSKPKRQQQRVAPSPSGRPVAQATAVPDDALQLYIKGDEGRQEIWAAANEEMRGVLAEGYSWIARTTRAGIMERYRLGELALRLDKDHMENREKRYGTYAVRRLADFMDEDKYTVHAALRLVKAYTRVQAEEAGSIRMADGRLLSICHIDLLLGMKHEERQPMLSRVLAGNWSARELAWRIKEQEAGAQEAKSADGRGRPLAVPRTLDAAIAQQGRSADDFLSRAEKVWAKPENSLISKVLGSARNPWTKEQADELLEHARKLRRLAAAALKHAEEAEATAAYVFAAPADAPGGEMVFATNDLASAELPASLPAHALEEIVFATNNLTPSGESSTESDPGAAREFKEGA